LFWVHAGDTKISRHHPALRRIINRLQSKRGRDRCCPNYARFSALRIRCVLVLVGLGIIALAVNLTAVERHQGLPRRGTRKRSKATVKPSYDFSRLLNPGTTIRLRIANDAFREVDGFLAFAATIESLQLDGCAAVAPRRSAEALLLIPKEVEPAEAAEA
jgi:hypothetical protein